jgi:DNA mismatch repair ATPase MutL
MSIKKAVFQSKLFLICVTNLSILILLYSEKPVNAIPKSGTIINLYKPFYNLPVRRQLAQKNATSNMKKIQELLIKYALAHPNVRLSSQQAKDTASASRNVTAGGNTWIKPVTTSITSTLGILFGAQLNDMLERFIETDPEHETLTIDAVLPKANSGNKR